MTEISQEARISSLAKELNLALSCLEKKLEFMIGCPVNKTELSNVSETATYESRLNSIEESIKRIDTITQVIKF